MKTGAKDGLQSVVYFSLHVTYFPQNREILVLIITIFSQIRTMIVLSEFSLSHEFSSKLNWQRYIWKLYFSPGN